MSCKTDCIDAARSALVAAVNTFNSDLEACAEEADPGPCISEAAARFGARVAEISDTLNTCLNACGGTTPPNAAANVVEGIEEWCPE